MTTARDVGPGTPFGLSPQMLVQMFDLAPDGIGIVQKLDEAEPFRFLYANRAFETIYQCDRDSIVGGSADAFMRARSGEADYLRVQTQLRGSEPFRIRRGFERPDGSFIWLEVHFQPLPGDRANSWMFISRDVTREKLQHERMVQLATAFEQGFDPVAISTPFAGKWPFAYVNEAFTRVTGYLPDDVIGQTWDMLVTDPGDKVRLVDIRAALFSGQQVRSELSYRTKDGRAGLFDVQIQPIRDPASSEPTSVVALFRDVTEIRRRERALLFEAEHDTLTALFNRRYFERILGTAISMTSDRPNHALIFADLDGFKDVNDRLGHDAGDQVLVGTARAFQNALFQTDVLARWGGDEFAALLFHCTYDNAVKTANDMVRALANSPDRAGTTVSIGVVEVRGGETVSDLIRRADRACYLAKAAGRDQVYAERPSGTA